VLKYALVNDFDITEVFEITKEEMILLSQRAAIFMCLRDTERLSNASPMGVLAFHTILNDEAAWAALREVILGVRAATGKPTPKKEPLPTKDGKVFWMVPTIPSDLRLN
jgi:hypothetical protein